jgi:hypothetical protein
MDQTNKLSPLLLIILLTALGYTGSFCVYRFTYSRMYLSLNENGHASRHREYFTSWSYYKTWPHRLALMVFRPAMAVDDYLDSTLPIRVKASEDDA